MIHEVYEVYPNKNIRYIQIYSVYKQGEFKEILYLKDSRGAGLAPSRVNVQHIR